MDSHDLVNQTYNQSEPSSFEDTTASRVDKCHLLSGRFGMLVQLSLGFVSLLALFIKWRRESHRRSLRIWKFDVLKQVVASVCAHFMNLIVALVLAGGGAAECPWYFVNFVFDTFAGIPMASCLLCLFQLVARFFDWEKVKETGYYGQPPQFQWWLCQLGVWTAIVSLTKTLLAIPLYIHRDRISVFAVKLFSPVRQEPHIELIIVMIIVPGLLNVLNFCLFDTLLKQKYESMNESMENMFKPLGRNEDQDPEDDKEFGVNDSESANLVES
mmetsp:Transcript_4067/g.4574  ORF Transcript_4067/g.4574 Transcript_4067/m.4574 type:complete len:271 (+) Transcript_4067:347-1159(+)